jgi:hypothetical protein
MRPLLGLFRPNLSAFRDPVREMDRQVGEMEGFGWAAEAPSRGSFGPAARRDPSSQNADRRECGKALLRSKREKLLQKSGSLGAGPGEDGVDEAKDGGEGAGLTKLEQPASDLSAARADGE